MLKKLPFLERLTTSKREEEPRISPAKHTFDIRDVCEVEESEVAVGAVVRADSNGDDGGIRDDEILSSDDEHVDQYVKDTDERVMLPLANVSNRTEMTCVGNLDENMQVQGDDSRPARDKANVTFAQKAARKALERQEKETRSKSRRLNR